jgi:hypothetical protein
MVVVDVVHGLVEVAKREKEEGRQGSKPTTKRKRTGEEVS